MPDTAKPVRQAADWDPAAAGTMGDQSAGGSYPNAVGATASGHASGGQTDPGYSGTGRLAGEKVGEGADANAVAHAEREHS